MENNRDNFEVATDAEMDEIMGEQVELEAAADDVMETAPEEKQSEDALEKAAEEDTEGNPFLVEFLREYQWDGAPVKSLDMSGLTELSAADGERFDRVLAKLGHAPANKFNDTTYCRLVAQRVTGLPSDFFKQLDIRDMFIVAAKVYHYFLYGSE